jgi:FlgD Ig-like domain
MFRIPSFSALIASLGPLSAIVFGVAPVLAAETAFRFSDLDVRDPHFYVDFIGCRDITDTPLAGFSINGDLQTSITTDADFDGLLDLSYLIAFMPLDQAGATGTLRFGAADCTAPLGSTTCVPGSSALQSISYTNSNSGSCLTAIAGTVFPYNPAITNSAAPCFVSDETTFTLALGGIPITLHRFRVAATYSGTPATQLVNGLFRGFISEADADATIIPASFPLVGGLPLSQLLPGGDPPGPGINCSSHNDQDLDAGTVGWWFYANFVANVVPFTDPTTAVEGGLSSIMRLGPVRPNPSSGSLVVDYSIGAASTVRLSVHDTQGRRVAMLHSGTQGPGQHQATWNGRDAAGTLARPGVYFVHFEALGRSFDERFVLLR